MTRRWRPSLAVVLGGALFGTLVLSFLGLVVFRYLGPEIGFRNAAFVMAAAIAAATAVLGAVLIRLLLRPIRALEAYAVSQETGATPQAEPAHFGTRELHATARRVIDMARALRDREATVRAFTDHVTHEVKTPVASIRAAVELLEDTPGLPPEARPLLSEIDGAWRQMEAQLAALRRAAQARETRYLGQCHLTDVAALLADMPAPTCRIGNGGTLPLPIGIDGLEIVLRQLASNAAAHGATLLSLSAHGQMDETTVTVQDNGPGISPLNAAQIFEPFFTTRRETGGTGMGLAVVRNLLDAHQAKIALLPSDTGALFQITFAAAHN